MQKRHTDRESYFDEQSQTSKNYYIPYIKEVIGHIPDKVLEVGCGEGGIFQLKDKATNFPLILLHDVIEHIRDKERFFSGLQEHLSADGAVFVGFPAWQMPFGGHQQIAHSHIVSHFPFLHLLPRTLYRWILRLCGEQERVIMELLDIKSTGCTIELFNRIARQANYQIIDRRLYLINPHYKIKFGLSPRRLNGVIAAIPYIRNFFCTSCFYILKKGTKTVNHY